MLKQKKWAKTGKIFTGCSETLISQSIGRGRICRVGSLVVRESRDWRDKQFKLTSKNKTPFWPEILY
jgi:hypothetical protein